MKTKTPQCSAVLQLMDLDYSYTEALNMVLQSKKEINKTELETELNNYV